MNWTDQQHAELARCFESGGVLAVANRAVELMAERGGTMTAEEVAEALECIREDKFPTIPGRLRGHISGQGARVAVLEANAETWLKRVEKAAEALSDVAPGELGRLDLVGRIERLKAERGEWKRRAESLLTQAEGLEAELARLRPSGQVAEDEQIVLKAMPSPTPGAAEAPSRLAAGAQEAKPTCFAPDTIKCPCAWSPPRPCAFVKGVLFPTRAQAWRNTILGRLAVWAVRHKIPYAETQEVSDAVEALESVATSAFVARVPVRITADGAPACGGADGDAPQEGLVEVVTVTHGMVGQAQTTEVSVRCPCSPTCTHDDNVNPGHPERVKERGEAVNEVIARADDDNTAAESDAERAGFEEGMAQGYDAGAEAMRAACWEAVQEELRRMGIVDPGVGMRLKAAIEEATP